MQGLSSDQRRCFDERGLVRLDGLIALGFKRYGFTDEVGLLARGISEAASHFLLNQLPELYAGIQRTPVCRFHNAAPASGTDDKAMYMRRQRR